MENTTDATPKGNMIQRGDVIRAMSNQDLAWVLWEFRVDAFGKKQGGEPALPVTQAGICEWLKEFVEDKTQKDVDTSFGFAIEAMKNGERVARQGWNGKDMYVFLAHEPDFVTDADISAFDQLEVEVADMLVMKTAQDTFQPGWLASQADMLADDWYIVE